MLIDKILRYYGEHLAERIGAFYYGLNVEYCGRFNGGNLGFKKGRERLVLKISDKDH